MPAEGSPTTRVAGNVSPCHDPYLRCAFYGAAQTAVGVSHACILAHSPQGCELLVGTAFSWQQADYIETKSLCTKLCEDEIVHGGEETLARTIEEAKAFDVPVVFVLTACGPEIVGDDIRAVCDEMADRVPFRLVPIECAGFRGSQYDGIDIALDAILSDVAGEASSPDDFAAGDGPIRDSVVVIAPHGGGNPTWPGDLAWTKATLERLGLRILVSLTHRTPLEDIALAGRAEWSLVLSHDCGYKAAEGLEKRHGVKPLLPGVPLPVGFAGTTRWLKALGLTLGREREAAAVVEEGEKFAVEQCRRQGLEIQFFNRARVAILADATLGLPFLRVAVEDLEMEPVAVGLRSKNPRALALLEAEAKKLGVPLALAPGAPLAGDRPGEPEGSAAAPDATVPAAARDRTAPAAARDRTAPATARDRTAPATARDRTAPAAASGLRIVSGLDVYQAKRLLADLRPDATVASNIERHLCQEVGIPYCFRVVNPVSRFRLTDRAYFGYTGFLNLIEIIQNDWWDAFRSKKKRWEAKW